MRESLPLPTREELVMRHRDYPLAQRLIDEFAPKLWKTPIAIKLVAPYRSRNGGTVLGECFSEAEPPYINMCLGYNLLNTKRFLDTLAHEIAHANVGRTGYVHDVTWQCEYFRLRDILKQLQIRLPRPSISC